MYTKSQGRFPHSMRVPENYSGNAFSAQKIPLGNDDPPSPVSKSESQEAPPPPQPDAATPVGACAEPHPRLGLSDLFSRFGMEELLLIGLILLLAEDGKNDELILLLIRLLFM